jgi:hypothetical protein
VGSQNDPCETSVAQRGIGRRALVAGGVASVAAAGLAVLSRPVNVRADDGDPVLAGGFNFAEHPTEISRDDPSAFHLVTLGDDSAVISAMTPLHNFPVIKTSTSGHRSQVALLADTTRSNGTGEGIGVKALTDNGTAIWAECSGGEAIHAVGVAHFSRVGRTRFESGQTSKTISGFRIATDTLVVATIQGNVADTWVRGVAVSVVNQRFTIRLNRAAPKALNVGWFIVN